MILKALLDDQLLELNIPEAFIEQSAKFFEKMDSDMDQGRQMGRYWLDNPDRMQRCQLAADGLLHALETGDDNLGRLMAGYILSRMPEAELIEFDPNGEVENHLVKLTPARGGLSFSTVQQDNQPDMSRNLEDPRVQEAMSQAEEEIAVVFKMGKQYKFSLLDPETGEWVSTPPIASREQAERMRQQALEQRCQEILARS